MARTRTIFVCQECAHESAKWMGKCPGCEAWNSFVEEEQIPEPPTPMGQKARAGYGVAGGHTPIRLTEVSASTEERVVTGISELDRVLGGGFVAGGVVMLGGDPGIGKSTLALQIAGVFNDAGKNTLYLSGEESLGQIRMRATRLGIGFDNVWVVSETSIERAEKAIREQKPHLVIIDSIQTLSTDRLTSAPGSVAQLREVTSVLTQTAKGMGVPMILVGHVTKSGSIAGPKVLEHMVDTVLYFENQSGEAYRVLRAVKNRFGSTNELGVFEMRSEGLMEVTNPSAMFLEERASDASGSVVFGLVEGTRPLLVELQALVSPTNYGAPRVTTVGIDTNRVILILSILEKRIGLQLSGMDVFVNVTGGVKISDPAADLALAIALVSSLWEKPVPAGLMAFGEIGLTGEIRSVSHGAARIGEAAKLGFSKALIPSRQKGIESSIQLITASSIQSAVESIFQ